MEEVRETEEAVGAPPMEAMAARVHAAGLPRAPAHAAPGAREEFVRMERLAETAAVIAGGISVGESFQYLIQAPVDLPRQQSALLPIVGSILDGPERLSIYNATTHPRHPMRGFRFENTTGAHLMRGPITVYDQGSYAGDTQIDDTPAGMARIIAYALDTDLEIESELGRTSSQIVAVQIVRGRLLTTRKFVRTTEYRIRNRSDRDKTLIIEHPITANWELAEPAEPEEKTAHYYRFRVAISANQSTVLRVRETSQKSESVELTNLSSNEIRVYLRMPELSNKDREALGRLLELQGRLARVQAEKERLENQINRLLRDQERIRENLAAVDSSSSLAQNYLRKLQEQEARLEQLHERVLEKEKQHEELSYQLDDFLGEYEVPF